MNNSRRKFLKVASISAFALGSGVASSMLIKDATAATIKGSYEKGSIALKAGRWAMVIDTRKFVSAEDFDIVIKACNNAHNIPNIPGDQDIKWLWADNYAQVFTDDTNKLMPERITDGKFLLLCNHCSDPPCVRVCPTQATFKMKDGTIAMDYHRCIGCRFCMAGCPYGARSFNYMDPRKHLKEPYPNPAYPTRMAGVVEKCTFCAERLAVGKMPACVEVTIDPKALMDVAPLTKAEAEAKVEVLKGAILFGDLDDPNSSVRLALAENFNIRRKPTLGTNPGVYYLV